MPDQKIENQLNLALNLSENIRDESSSLETGYDPSDNTWEVVVRYNGSLEELREQYDISITYLLAGYAVLKIPEQYISEVARKSCIEYMEKPKAIYYNVEPAKKVSCFGLKPVMETDLTGAGTLIAVIDSGVYYQHPAFRKADGSTKILYMWDQQESSGEYGNPPEGYTMGVEYDSGMIDLALMLPPSERRNIINESDPSGHGTHVLGIASDCAPESGIIFVKLADRGNPSYSLSTELMQAVNYVVEKAMMLEKPVSINLSYGNSYGDHNGTSLIETFIDDIYGLWKQTIVIGTGNEGAANRHVSGVVGSDAETVDLLIYRFTPSFDIQIWKNYSDDIAIEIISPEGNSTGQIRGERTISSYTLYNTDIYIFFGEPSPYNINQEIYIEMIPRGGFFNEGLWKIRLNPYNIISGRYDMWLPAGRILDNGTGFLGSESDISLTIPSTAGKPISVGAYDSDLDIIAFFSGRGFVTGTTVKPEIVAPGVNIYSAAVGGGYTFRTGTSMAVPFVTGAACNLMQWGITLKNDPYLYGDKIKAYLIKGARRLPGYDKWPNPVAGWGALCLKNSLPEK